jgi:hypothetical protein
MIRFRLRFNRVVADDAGCRAILPGFASASWRDLEGGHFSIPNAYSDPGMTGLALTPPQIRQ